MYPPRAALSHSRHPPSARHTHASLHRLSYPYPDCTKDIPYCTLCPATPACALSICAETWLLFAAVHRVARPSPPLFCLSTPTPLQIRPSARLGLLLSYSGEFKRSSPSPWPCPWPCRIPSSLPRIPSAPSLNPAECPSSATPAVRRL